MLVLSRGILLECEYCVTYVVVDRFYIALFSALEQTHCVIYLTVVCFRRGSFRVGYHLSRFFLERLLSDCGCLRVDYLRVVSCHSRFSHHSWQGIINQ